VKIDRGGRTAHPRDKAEIREATCATAQAVADTFPGVIVVLILALPGTNKPYSAASNAENIDDAIKLLRAGEAMLVGGA